MAPSRELLPLNHKLLLVYWRCYYLGFSSLAPFAANECRRQTNSESIAILSEAFLYAMVPSPSYWLVPEMASQNILRISLYRQKGKIP